MISKLSLLILTLAITANIVSANSNPCLNFTDWISFKTSYVTKYLHNTKGANPYAIQFKDISHENIA